MQNFSVNPSVSSAAQVHFQIFPLISKMSLYSVLNQGPDKTCVVCLMFSYVSHEEQHFLPSRPGFKSASLCEDSGHLTYKVFHVLNLVIVPFRCLFNSTCFSFLQISWKLVEIGLVSGQFSLGKVMGTSCYFLFTSANMSYQFPTEQCSKTELVMLSA